MMSSHAAARKANLVESPTNSLGNRSHPKLLDMQCTYKCISINIFVCTVDIYIQMKLHETCTPLNFMGTHELLSLKVNYLVSMLGFELGNSL